MSPISNKAISLKKPKSEMIQILRKDQSLNPKTEKVFDFRERTFNFSLRIIDIAETLPKSLVNEIIRRQVMRSGMSIGANFEEADGSVSKKDFINKASIARKEANETKYWLKIINTKNDNIDLQDDIQEVQEIINILSTMIKNTEKSKRKK